MATAAPPLPCADDDVAQAIVAKWNADPRLSQGTQPLVPGGIQNGRLSSYQPGAAEQQPATPGSPTFGTPASATAQATQAPIARRVPYASVDVTKAREGNHQTGGDYIDFRLATIEIRGRKPDVAAAVAYARNAKVFNRQPLPTLAPFLTCLQQEGDDLRQDQAMKAGEDVWVGTIVLEVWTQRPE
ncbi:MAG: hypothetical protein K2R98_08510 [Gemmataceae bacterium]|nr:hypothetical protein [Gemmataceae bacterium]